MYWQVDGNEREARFVSRFWFLVSCYPDIRVKFSRNFHVFINHIIRRNDLNHNCICNNQKPETRNQKRSTSA